SWAKAWISIRCLRFLQFSWAEKSGACWGFFYRFQQSPRCGSCGSTGLAAGACVKQPKGQFQPRRKLAFQEIAVAGIRTQARLLFFVTAEVGFFGTTGDLDLEQSSDSLLRKKRIDRFQKPSFPSRHCFRNLGLQPQRAV